MCRICGRMVKCIFDSMPSKRPPSSRSFSTVAKATRTATPSRHVASRSLIQSTFNITSSSHLPPSFLLPYRSLHQATIPQQNATPAPHFQQTSPHVPPTSLSSSTPATPSSQTPLTNNYLPHTSSTNILESTTPKPLVLSKSLQQLLPALHAQPPHYITAHIHRFPYLLTAGDTLRLPFFLSPSTVQPGDILRLNRASILGSRDFTLKAGTSNTHEYDRRRTGEPNYLDERLFVCRVRVMGWETEPMRLKEKTKRRQRRVKTVKSKVRYTVLRITEVRVKSLEELMQSKDGVVLE